MTDLIERNLRRLSKQMQGHISRPGDDGYNAANAIWAKTSLAQRSLGMLFYPFSEASAVLGRCDEIAASSPEDLTIQVGLV